MGDAERWNVEEELLRGTSSREVGLGGSGYLALYRRRLITTNLESK